MIVRHSPGPDRITVGGDKGFDTADFVADPIDGTVVRPAHSARTFVSEHPSSV